MHCASSSCRWRRPSAGMEKSCEYIKQAVLDSRQGVVLETGLGDHRKTASIVVTLNVTLRFEVSAIC